MTEARGSAHVTDGPHDPIAWVPTESYLERSRLRTFCRATGNDSLDGMRAWAAANIGRYWDAVVKDLGLEWTRPYRSPLDLSGGKPWPEWFVDGGFNYVVDAVDRHATGEHAERVAITWEGDDGERRSLTFRELRVAVDRLANGLRTLGVDRGDRVGIFLPMLPETAIATLACGKIGAIFIPLFSGFGADAVASRLADCGASVLITCDAFPRRGKPVRTKEVADVALGNVPSVTACIVLKRSGESIDWTFGRDHWWHEVVDGQPDTAQALDTAANDPYMIIYTSGTTGNPKGTVHVHAGFPIKAAHDLAYCFDLHDDDTLFWLTDLGWMMGPWLISGGLLLGATIVLFEGTPDFPEPDRLWTLVETHGATVLGVAPTVIRSLKAHGDDIPRRHNLSSLRVLGSTGETWTPEAWWWLFDVIGERRLPIINYSGGTETSGGILACFTSEPISPGAFTGPVPGMDADVVDENGVPLRSAVGELVVRQPWVGMTRGFWHDRQRYLDSYWTRFPDTWVHGDWTEIDNHGYWHIRGRSDDVLKIAGKRIGPAELESAATSHPGVLECAAIGVPHPVKGECGHLFVVPMYGKEGAPTLADDIRATVRQHLGAAMQPEKVHFVRELPKTRNGKIMRRVVRAAYLGLPTGDASALESGTIIDEIAHLREQ